METVVSEQSLEAPSSHPLVPAVYGFQHVQFGLACGCSQILSLAAVPC